MQKGSIGEKDLEPDVSYFQFYIEAFKELSSCRNSFMALGPIPFTAISEYFKIYGRESGYLEDFDEFIYLIRRMDDTFLELVNAKNKKENTKKPKVASKNAKRS